MPTPKAIGEEEAENPLGHTQWALNSLIDQLTVRSTVEIGNGENAHGIAFEKTLSRLCFWRELCSFANTRSTSACI